MFTAEDISKSNSTVHIGDDETVSRLLGEMKKKQAEEALVFSKKGFKGIFSQFQMLRSRADVSHEKVRKYTVPCARINPDTDLIAISAQMLDSTIRSLPIFDAKGQNQVSTIDIYGLLEKIKEHLSEDHRIDSAIQIPLYVRSDEKLGKLIHLMHSKKLREIPLMDKTGELSGIITVGRIMDSYHLHHTQERQHAQRPDTPENTIQTEKKDLLELPAENFSEPFDLSVGHDNYLSEAAAMMAENKRTFLFVEEYGIIKGIVTAEGILKRFLDVIRKTEENIRFRGFSKAGVRGVEFETINEIASIHANKLKAHIKNIMDLRIHLKENDSSGKRSRYQVLCHLSAPGRDFSSESAEWDVVTAVRMALSRIEKQVKSRYR